MSISQKKMATPDIYHIPSTQPNMNNPGEGKSDINYVPAPQPPTSYPMQPPPPYAAPPPQQPMYPSHPMVIAPMQIPYQGVIVINNNFMHPEISRIRDYLVWSIINVFVGGFILGIIAVLLSIQTRNRKLIGDIQGARSMSKVTLIFNILITIVSFCLTAFLIVYFVFFVSFVNTHNF